MKLEGILADPEMVVYEGPVMDTVKRIVESKTQDTPFFIFNVGSVMNKLRNWKRVMPRVKPFYAVKCNNNKILLKLLKDLGVGFDCATKSEIESIVGMNVDPSRIIFAHPCKMGSHLNYADQKGVDLMTFDCESELYKIKKRMPHARLVLRIRCDALDAQAPLGMKFGAMPENASGLLLTAKKLELNIVGVSFHVGSGCREPAVFTRAIRASKTVFNQAVEIGFNPYLLDIGGGFPGDENSSLDECASYISPALDEYFPESMNCEIISEPGRYVAASAFLLVTQVISKKEEKTPNGLSYMYYINDGLYGSFNCVLFDHQIVSPTLLKETSGLDTFHSSIWGPTCDGLDKVMDDVYLPQIQIGDWIMWKNMGAYTLASAGTFNSLPLAEVHPVISSHGWMLLEKGLEIDSLGKLDQSIQ